MTVFPTNGRSAFFVPRNHFGPASSFRIFPFASRVKSGRPSVLVVDLTVPRTVTWTSGSSDSFASLVAFGSGPRAEAAGAVEGDGDAASTGSATAIARTATTRTAARWRGRRIRGGFTSGVYAAGRRGPEPEQPFRGADRHRFRHAVGGPR